MMKTEGWSRAKTIFHRALEIPAERRMDFLAESCAGDFALRAQVQQLLDNSEDTISIIEAEECDRTLPLLQPSHCIFTVGDIVAARYEVIRFIAKGGMGEVYEVEDRELRSRVALKTIMLSPVLSSHLLSRFKREIQLARKVTHRNVCRVYDLGHHNHPAYGDILFLTMELLQGTTLAEYLHQHGAMTCNQTLPLISQMVSALSAAHELGIVHRDFKPGNVMLIEEAGERVVKVTDFGLARSLRPQDNSTLSHAEVVGTPSYMSPEQFRGEYGPETDVYALGLTIFVMLTAKLPISRSAPFKDVPTDKAKQIGSRWQNVITKCVAAEPTERFHDVRDVWRTLVGSRSASYFDLAALASAVTRHAVAFTGVAVLLIAWFGLIWAGILPNPLARILHFVEPAVHDKVIAVMPFESIDNDPATNALGLGLTETVTAKLVQASDTGHVQLVSARELIAGGVKNAEEARRQFGTDLVLEGSVQQSGELIRITCSVVDSKTRREIAARTLTGQANEIFALQDRFVNELLEMLPVVIRPEQRHLLDARQDTQPNAYDFYLRGRGYLQEYEKPENIDSAIIQFERALQVDQKYAPAYAGLGAAYATLFEQRNQSKEWLEKTRSSCQQALAIAPDLAEAHTCLGHFYLGTGQYEAAVKEFQQSLDLNKESDETLGGLADAYQKLGNTGAAEQAYRSAIALRPNYWGGYSGLGAFYYTQARYADAAEMFRKVTSLAPENYRGYSNLGAMELLLGRYSDSIAALKTSIALRPDFESYGNLGTSYFLLHEFDSAAQNFEAAVRLEDKDWASWGNLADALYQIPSRRSEALHAYEKAIELANAKIEINPRDASALACVADYNAMLGKKAAAMANLHRALAAAPTDADVHFRAAILYNHFGDAGNTMKLLKQAVDLGFSANVIRDTPDFDHLKNDARVRELLGLN